MVAIVEMGTGHGAIDARQLRNKDSLSESRLRLKADGLPPEATLLESPTFQQ